MSTTDDLRELLDRMRRASAFVDPPEAIVPLITAVEAVLDKERKPDPDTWDLWDWGYDRALDDAAGLIRAALIGDDDD